MARALVVILVSTFVGCATSPAGDIADSSASSLPPQLHYRLESSPPRDIAAMNEAADSLESALGILTGVQDIRTDISRHAIVARVQPQADAPSILPSAVRRTVEHVSDMWDLRLDGS